MSFFSEQLAAYLKSVGLEPLTVIQKTGLSKAGVYHVLRGTRRPTDNFLKRLAEIEQLDVPYTQLRAWRAKDDYPELF